MKEHIKGYDYALAGSEESWLLWAREFTNMTEEEAKVEWIKVNELDKYLVCEAREDDVTRLFIRNVTNEFEDALKKDGWWNIFTRTDIPCKEGLWLCRAVDCRLDKNGYVNLIVVPVKNVTSVELYPSYWVKNGSWESNAWWLMAGRARTFMSLYKFNLHTVNNHHPNIEFLEQEHPELVKDSVDISRMALLAYTEDNITLAEIERCLDMPSEWEHTLFDILQLWRAGNLEKVYGEKYPIFCKKLGNALGQGVQASEETLNEYIDRQYAGYVKLVGAGVFNEDENLNPLERAEKVLAYREEEKHREKEAKKAAKRAAKANK